MSDAFTKFFRDATRTEREPDGRDPYPYQVRFATEPTLPHLLRAPTGAGKTATAVLGWLWRWHTKVANTPRRLVYCLPMRVLVEQSHREAAGWLVALGMRDEVSLPLPLMGGSDSGDWHLYPEKPAILIGTQDMLLSRALNRGYAATRFHWPIDFGLLNNDCLWVFDEPQLMASGVSTSAQLAGLRHEKTFGVCPSVWMSATLEPTWLDTVDFRGKFTTAPLELTDADYRDERLDRRMTAVKTLGKLSAAVSKDMKDVAKEVLAAHKDETQTLVVLNTVDRAKATYDALQALKKKEKREGLKLLLVHSRFRPHERRHLNDALQDKGEAAKNRIIVATQVVEAGVDISSHTLVTELAPWASVVQRIGRCNRTGDDGTKENPARVFWINSPEIAQYAEAKKVEKDVEKRRKEAEKPSLPYMPDELLPAAEFLNALDGEDVSPKALDEFKTANNITLPFAHKHVIRRRDLLDLFDTAPDLSGNDIDVSRFVRSDDPDTDVQVFWRAEPPRDDWDARERRRQAARREELCNVPIGSFKKDFLDAGKTAWRFDHLDDDWREIGKRDAGAVVPGQAFWIVADQGGYDAELGWSPSAARLPATLLLPLPDEPGELRPEEAAGSDPNSETPKPRTIAEHTAGVCTAVDSVLGAVAELLTDGWPDHLRTAARWHDAGKAHEVFREAMDKLNGEPPAGQHWAKSGGNGRLGYKRKHFRHELASALAALKRELPFKVAYLIASHHGKVRLSIRALPGEEPPRDKPDTLFALGVRSGDKLPPLDLGAGSWPETELDLSPMQLGGDSWTGRALKLLDELGPFRLAYLEALLRAADQRVSNAEQKGEAP
jgi:CRISPR-associated endonuclease/helicase Cas3